MASIDGPLEDMRGDKLVVLSDCGDVLSVTPHLHGESDTSIAERTVLDVLDQGL